MKVIAAYKKQCNDPTGLGIMIWPDSAVVRSGKPVFIPEDGYTVVTGIGAKITAVGKTIRPKFATRYYEEMMPMAILLTKKAASEIKKGTDPGSGETVADYSVITGETFPKTDSEGEIEITLTPLDGNSREEVEKTSFEDMEDKIAGAIARASEKNTLKTGDVVALLLTKPREARRETLFKIRINGNTLLENKLK